VGSGQLESPQAKDGRRVADLHLHGLRCHIFGSGASTGLVVRVFDHVHHNFRSAVIKLGLNKLLGGRGVEWIKNGGDKEVQIEDPK
jgi:hypothetical protein